MVTNSNNLQHVSPNKKIYELKKNIIATNSYYHSSNNSTSYNKIVYPSNISGSMYNHTRNKSSNVTGQLLIEDNNLSLNNKSQSNVLKPRQKIIDKSFSKSIVNSNKLTQNNSSNISNLTNSKSNSEVNSLIASNLNSNSRNINKESDLKKYTSNYSFNYKKSREIKEKDISTDKDKEKEALYKSYLNTDFANNKQGLSSFKINNKPVSVMSNNNDSNYLNRDKSTSMNVNNGYLNNNYSRNTNNFNTPLSFLTNPTPYNQLGSYSQLNNTSNTNMNNVNNIPNLNVSVSHIRIDLGNSNNNNNFIGDQNHKGNMKNIDKIFNHYDPINYRNNSLEYNISKLKNEVKDENKDLNENIYENLNANNSNKINVDMCDTEFYQKTVSSINNELKSNNENSKDNLLYEIDELLKQKLSNVFNIQRKFEQTNENGEKVYENIECFTEYRSLFDEIIKSVSLIISKEKTTLSASLSKNFSGIFNRLMIGLSDSFFKAIGQLNSAKEILDSNSNLQKNYDSMNKKYLESLKIINSYKAENKKLSENISLLEKENVKCKKF